MKLPVLKGTIRRRILANFRVDPQVVQPLLPAGFRPKLQAGHAIAGVCLIRLEGIRPRFAPAGLGIASENAAHRIAVLWEDRSGAAREGVYIPRRDTGSFLNHLAGGRIFPGRHHRASFLVREGPGTVDLRMESRDRAVSVRVRGRVARALPASSCFASLEEASSFFEKGSLGYSPAPTGLEGMVLRTHGWKVEPLEVEEVYSSWLADPTRFPPGSLEFDCALLMRDLEHEWHAAETLAACLLR